MDVPAIAKNIAEIGRISAVPKILRLICELTQMRVALVARVTPDSWTTCAIYDTLGFGLHVGDRLDLAKTLCREVCADRKSIIIEHASTDAQYSTHLVPKMYNIESYISIPILRPDGDVFGTLCAIDRAPAKLDPKIINSLQLFAELISSQLRSETVQEETNELLWNERKLSLLREQFIAVLGHDLRSPLGAVELTTEVLVKQSPSTDQRELLQGIQDSCQQMSHLIDDILDFARGRLGDGISITRRPVDDLTQLVRLTANELSRAHPGRVLKIESAKPHPASVDEVRFRQLLSNLIGNALQHSPTTEPVSVKVEEVGGLIRLSISNGGPGLPPEVRNNLFAPFVRQTGAQANAGLGLGLFISAEIAKAHGGSIHAESEAGLTTFTVLIPGASEA